MQPLKPARIGKAPAYLGLAVGVALASTVFFHRLMDRQPPPKPVAAVVVQKDTAKPSPVHIRVNFKKATLKKAKAHLLAHGFGKAEADSILYDYRVEKLPIFRQKPDSSKKKMTYEEYKRRFGVKQLTLLGSKFYESHKTLVDSLQSASNAPNALALSILGIESIYGKTCGNYRTLNVFLTVLEDRPKRTEFALGELGALLRLCKKYGKDPLSIRGSHWGAIVPAQFIPSSLERFEPALGCKTFEELSSIETSLRLVYAYLSVAGASARAGFSLYGTNFKAAFAYNHSDWYARLAVELAGMIKKKLSEQLASEKKIMGPL